MWEEKRFVTISHDLLSVETLLHILLVLRDLLHRYINDDFNHGCPFTLPLLRFYTLWLISELTAPSFEVSLKSLVRFVRSDRFVGLTIGH